jgi:hypothetical protein
MQTSCTSLAVAVDCHANSLEVYPSRDIMCTCAANLEQMSVSSKREALRTHRPRSNISVLLEHENGRLAKADHRFQGPQHRASSTENVCCDN